MSPVDPHAPSFRAAVFWAKEAAFLSMRADSRSSLSAADRAAGNAVLARLLNLVEYPDGFLGASDGQREAMQARLQITDEQMSAAMYAPGSWPKRAAEQRVAA